MDPTHDWSFLPPPALELVGKALPSISLLRARLVCKHWAQTLCGVVDQLNIVPEAFSDSDTAARLYMAYPRASKVILDLQDTYTLVPAPDLPVATPDDVAAALPEGLVIENISTDPRPEFIQSQCSHLQIRLPDTTETTAHDPDIPMSWVYIDNLLSLHGQQLQSLHMTTAPGPQQITVLSMLTQLSSLTMDEASHTMWSNEHIPIIGTLTNLRTLTLKIPQYRGEQASRSSSQLTLLQTWTAMTNLSKLHVCVMRYSYHASLVNILPALKSLESLAIRAPQTRLPWPGSDRPLFDNIGLLTNLTSLSLALVDHTMQAVHWSALQPLTGLTSLELSMNEQVEQLSVPQGMAFKNLKLLKLRYPNSHDLVRIAQWSTLQRLDIKFTEHEREWHQEDACQELIDVVPRLPPSPGVEVITSVLAPTQQSAAGSTTWWSPLLPLLALPKLTDFRCSAKEGLASHDPILFDEILTGMSVAWPGVTRLAFKGNIQVQSQSRGWDSFKAMSKLQQLELRHHPPGEAGDSEQLNRAADARSKYVRVEPIRLPATSLPDSLQTLLLENVELRRKESECLRALTSLERRTTCRHFPEFSGMPLQRLVVSNCCVKAKGITSIAGECGTLTHLVFAVYKVTEPADLVELQNALREMVRSLRSLQVLKIRVQAACITQELLDDMVAYLPSLQRLKLTSSDGWQDITLFSQLPRIATLRKCSLAYFKNAGLAKQIRAVFRKELPYCKLKAKYENTPPA